MTSDGFGLGLLCGLLIGVFLLFAHLKLRGAGFKHGQQDGVLTSITLLNVMRDERKLWAEGRGYGQGEWPVHPMMRVRYEAQAEGFEDAAIKLSVMFRVPLDDEMEEETV